MEKKTWRLAPILVLSAGLGIAQYSWAEEGSTDGVTIEASLVAVGQHAFNGVTSGGEESAFNYRGDVSLSTQAGTWGGVSGELFAHLRLGKGNGLENLSPTLTGTANSTVFAARDGYLTARLAQLWYSLDVPVGDKADERQGQLVITAGKIDPFVFFDQNDIADDESAAFLNNVFVHNPMLDSGGHVEADEYGFAPGVRLAYRNDMGDAYWQASIGFFAKHDRSKPFVIGQFERHDNFMSGMPGSFRLYAWRGAHSTPYANEYDSSVEKHSGWGVSANQKLAEYLTVFARYGHSTKGRVQFDRAATLGVEIGGALWSRENDRIGLAAGWLNTSKGFRSAAPTLDTDGDTSPDFGFSPGGAEKQYEIYYAWQITDFLEISPDYQWIKRPAGNPLFNDVSIIGLRVKLSI